MIDIIFEAHGTTYDNASDLSSGWKDVDLSPLGIEQAFGLGQRYKDTKIESVFTSDLIRATRTADIAFGERSDLVIVADTRLRECNYGDLNGVSKDIVEPLKKEHISTPFPHGESYEDCMKRMKSFLDELRTSHDGKTVLIIGHRATQFGLDYWINHTSLDELTTAHFVWQPGWKYQLG